MDGAAALKCSMGTPEKTLRTRERDSKATITPTKKSTVVKLEKEEKRQLAEGTQSVTGSTERSRTGILPPLENQHSQLHTTRHQVPYTHALTEKHQAGDESPHPGVETQAWPFASQLSGSSMPSCSYAQGRIQPRRKTPGLPASVKQCSQLDCQPSERLCKKEQKPKKPGKYVCHYCGRACAKPSVLKKHIRSHTGERPYPCVPCGFSFKTKSNLYKHRKSHTHAVKAGLVSFSEQDTQHASVDEELTVEEGEMLSDADQSTDTDEEGVEDLFLDRNSPVHLKDSGSALARKGGKLTKEESVKASVEITKLSTSKKEVRSASGKVCLSQFRETKAPAVIAEVDQAVESCSVKQRLALRLSEKISQDSEHSLSLPSSYSKGSTDSGYFSRSESAEHQVSPPCTNVKSYQELMFGKCYRPSPRPRQSITVQTCMKDSNESSSSVMVKMAKGKVYVESMTHSLTNEKDSVGSIMMKMSSEFPGEDSRESQISDSCQSSSDHMAASTDTGSLIRSNSLPTSPEPNLSMPQGLRGSNSFDERMSADGVSYRGPGGMRRLMRQAAFELPSHEGHVESDNYGNPTSTVVKPELKAQGIDDARGGIEMYPETETCLMHQSYVMDIATRKRRKEKSVLEEEDFPCHGNRFEEMSGLSGDYDSKQNNPDAIPIGKGQSFPCVSDRSDIGAGSDDTEKRTGSNVISVIQHTNSVSRLNSAEKSESIDCESHQQGKSVPRQFSEQTDRENIEEGDKTDPLLRSEIIERQWGNNKLASQKSHMPHQLVCQSSIQVPEIRVTEEPDRPAKVSDAQIKQREKPASEEFQWPQRSETLSQFPVEKLPPKKKRLRLAEMDYSSGESSFESACTSLSRSPSQDSNFSHSSSFSLSLDRDEGINPASSTKQDEFGKPLELLSVPGSGHSLSIPGLHRQKEMRRSSSEQAPFTLPTEVPGLRSKSFDYGSLSPLSRSRQGEVYASSSGMRERRRGYLVRQASQSVDPEGLTQDKSMDVNVTQNCPEYVHHSLSLSPCPGSPSENAAQDALVRKVGITTRRVQHASGVQESQREGQVEIYSPYKQSSENRCSSGQETMWYSLLLGSLTPQLPVQSGLFWKPELQDLHIRQLHKEKNEQGDSKPAASFVRLRDPPQDLQHLSNILSTIEVLSQAQPILANLNTGSQQSHCGSSVPVRIQMHVPSYGNITYTSMSQVLDSHMQSVNTTIEISKTTSQSLFANVIPKRGEGYDLSQILQHPRGLLHNPQLSPAKLNTGIPLSLTSETISTTEAPSGGSKRMLSPASSIELIEAKQQKRVKEDTMYGQIVEELGAVELGNPDVEKDTEKINSKIMTRSETLAPLSPPCSSKASLSTITPHLQVVKPSDSLTVPPKKVIDTSAEPLGPAQEIQVDEPNQDLILNPDSASSTSVCQEALMINKMQMPVQLAASHGISADGTAVLLPEITNARLFSQFPSLHTTTCVSWCYLNSMKPNSTQTAPLFSVYATWFMRSHNPNPPNLSTRTILALHRSKQKKHNSIYTIAAMYQPEILVSSLFWRQQQEQEIPELRKEEIITYDTRIKDISRRSKTVNQDHKESEASLKQTESSRIKIFEGGYKSNEDYVYVRGRGRGKYICEECGIRCKKPSMLKKHIRTHTDVRPYVCKCCNFAFKTKGNLTKHMKSKAHMKKCLELGVSITSKDNVEDADNVEDMQKESGKTQTSDAGTKHQFSDVDDSDGVDEDGDELDEDEDEEYEGDSTPKTQSRSTSPQPRGINTPLLSTCFTPLRSTDIHLTSARMVPGKAQTTQPLENDGKRLEESLDLSRPREEDGLAVLSLGQATTSFDSYPSHLLPPHWESPQREPSPTHQRYLTPRRDLSPRGHLSPRRDTSPLKPISPKRRDFSPVQQLLPISLGKPMSPGQDPLGRRELSPRGRHRGVLRAASPRRGSFQHRTHCDQARSTRPEVIPQGQIAGVYSDMGVDQRKSILQNLYLHGDVRSSKDPLASHRDVFSHLPLHSQHQVQTAHPIVPIGGVQIVPSTPPPGASVSCSSHSSWQKGLSEEAGTSQASAHVQELGLEEPSRQKERPSLHSPDSQEKASDRAVGNISLDGSVQTCMEAIASLRITAEAPGEKTSNS